MTKILWATFLRAASEKNDAQCNEHCPAYSRAAFVEHAELVALEHPVRCLVFGFFASSFRSEVR